VGLEWGPLSPVSTIEELLGRKSSGSGLENGVTAIGIIHPDHWTTSLYNRLLCGVSSGLSYVLTFTPTTYTHFSSPHSY
jgi:hypothetical protein